MKYGCKNAETDKIALGVFCEQILGQFNFVLSPSVWILFIRFVFYALLKKISLIRRHYGGRKPQGGGGETHDHPKVAQLNFAGIFCVLSFSGKYMYNIYIQIIHCKKNTGH